MELENLPPGWRWKYLDDLAVVVRGGSPRPKGDPRYFGGSIPWIMISDINREKGKFISKTKDHVTEEGAKLSRFLKSGTLILSNSGTICVPKILAVDGCIHDEFIAFLELKPEVDKLFLYYYLDQIRPMIKSENHQGITQVNLNKDIVKKIPIPLPPLAEQQRIVTRVEALLTHVNAACDRLRRVPLIMKRFRQAVLAAACSGRLTEGWREENPDIEPANALISKILDERKLWYDSEFNKAKLDGRKKPKKPKFLRNETTSEELLLGLPDSWDICFFEDIAANLENAIKAGPFGSSLTKSCYTKSGYKIYGQEQVIKGDPAYGDYWISEEKYREFESCKVRPDDILISLVGTVGKVLILPKDCKAGIINPRLVKLSIDQKISKQYMKNYLDSPIAKNRLFGDSHGGTMEILNLEILKNLPIPLPPLAEQHEIVRRVGLLFERADAFDHEVAAASRRCERLTQEVLGKAFAGKL